MSKLFLFLPVILLFVSCVGYQPPKRPVANLFPTVVSMREVQMLKPVSMTPGEMESLLEKAGFLQSMRELGMLDSDLATMARAMSTRGYAELDCRKCYRSAVRWLSIRHTEKNTFVIAGFENFLPPEFTNGIDFSQEAQRVTREGVYGDYQLVDTWQKAPFTARRIIPFTQEKNIRWELEAAF